MHLKASGSPDEIFRGFEWKTGEKPKSLALNEAGFLVDPEGNWYLVRKTKNARPLDAVKLEDLYNGTSDTAWQATEGRGLYFTNFPEAAERALFVGGRTKIPNQLYVARVNPKALLDAGGAVFDAPKGQRAAVALLRTRAVVPGVPHPTRDGYDRLYGDADVVTTRPLAMARVTSGFSRLTVNDKSVTPRWAIVRDKTCLEIVGQRPGLEFGPPSGIAYGGLDL